MARKDNSSSHVMRQITHTHTLRQDTSDTQSVDRPNQTCISPGNRNETETYVNSALAQIPEQYNKAHPSRQNI